VETVKFDSLLKLLSVLTQGLRDIPHTFKLLWSVLSLKQSKKKNIVGDVNRKIAPHTPKQIGLKDIKGISSRRIVFMIILLFILLAATAALLWHKLTVISTYYASDTIATDSLPKEEKKEQSQEPKAVDVPEVVPNHSRSGFLPAPTVAPPNSQEKPLEKKETIDEKVPGSTPIEEIKHTPQEQIEKGTPSIARLKKQPYVNLTNTVIDTINPQFLLEHPVTSNHQVSIIVSGLGLNTKISDAVIDQLPTTITLAVSPYTRNIDNFIEILKLQGFDVLMGVLLEDGRADVDLGWMTLRTKSTKESKEKLLNQYLDLARKCTGFYAEAGHLFLKSYSDVGEFLELITPQKNFIIAPSDVLMNQFHKAAAKSQTNYAGVTLLSPDIALSSEFISFIKRTGYGILAFDVNADGVAEKIIQWIKLLSENKISVVPISDLLQDEGNDIKSNQ
jgi:polysaccharide deacetylase 2 family uncharacterized protein YibQ